MFDTCTTEAELTQVYRKESLRVHPDRGGSVDKFQQLQNEYDRRLRMMNGEFTAADFFADPYVSDRTERLTKTCPYCNKRARSNDHWGCFIPQFLKETYAEMNGRYREQLAAAKERLHRSRQPQAGTQEWWDELQRKRQAEEQQYREKWERINAEREAELAAKRAKRLTKWRAEKQSILARGHGWCDACDAPNFHGPGTHKKCKNN